MRRFFLAIVFLFLASFGLQSQTYTDALRYSYLDLLGSARFTATAGALGPLGADFSVVNTNPAGIAWMRKSQFTFSPGFNFISTDSQLDNGQGNESFRETYANFNIPAVGVVVTSQPVSEAWSTFNFAIGLNRIADFNRDFFYQGLSQGSIVDRFLEQANSPVGLNNGFEAGLAFDADALLGNEEEGFFSDFETNPDAVIEREQLVMQRGSINELSFAFGGNYREKVLWGLSIGVPILSFREEKQYFETDVNSEVDFFNDLRYDENLTTTGQGINFKLGLIFRVSQELRFGLAAHSPTFYSLQDNFRTSMVYNYTFNNQDNQGRASSPDGIFDYRLQTPWRLSGGFGYIFGKNGFISADVEYVNYEAASFRYDGFAADEREVNQSIDNNLTSGINVRLGGEYAYEVFRFRAGLALQQSGIEGDDTFYNTYSLGAGFRQNNFSFDLAWRTNTRLETYTPYLTFEANQQFVDNDVTRNQVVLTFGFGF